MQPWLDRWIAELAAAQHGVATWAQLRDAGVARGAVDRRLANGRLHAVHRGVYAVGHPVLGREGRWLAAVLAHGDDAVLSHRSAAALWGLAPNPGPSTHVTIRGRGSVKRRAGIVAHRSAELEATVHEGIPVTSPARTIVDVAGIVSRRVLEQVVAEAVRLRVFDRAALEAVARNGRRGARAVAEVVAAYDDAPTRSELERRFLRLCRAYGLPRPQVNTQVEGLEVDFAWPGARVVVETDGGRHHGTPQAMERDRARDATLTLAGWRALRFTWRQVVHEPAVVAAVLRNVLGDAPNLRRCAA